MNSYKIFFGVLLDAVIVLLAALGAAPFLGSAPAPLAHRAAGAAVLGLATALHFRRAWLPLPLLPPPPPITRIDPRAQEQLDEIDQAAARDDGAAHHLPAAAAPAAPAAAAAHPPAAAARTLSSSLPAFRADMPMAPPGTLRAPPNPIAHLAPGSALHEKMLQQFLQLVSSPLTEKLAGDISALTTYCRDVLGSTSAGPLFGLPVSLIASPRVLALLQQVTYLDHPTGGAPTAHTLLPPLEHGHVWTIGDFYHQLLRATRLPLHDHKARLVACAAKARAATWGDEYATALLALRRHLMDTIDAFSPADLLLARLLDAVSDALANQRLVAVVALLDLQGHHNQSVEAHYAALDAALNWMRDTAVEAKAAAQHGRAHDAERSPSRRAAVAAGLATFEDAPVSDVPADLPAETPAPSFAQQMADSISAQFSNLIAALPKADSKPHDKPPSARTKAPRIPNTPDTDCRWADGCFNRLLRDDPADEKSIARCIRRHPAAPTRANVEHLENTFKAAKPPRSYTLTSLALLLLGASGARGMHHLSPPPSASVVDDASLWPLGLMAALRHSGAPSSLLPAGTLGADARWGHFEYDTVAPASVAPAADPVHPIAAVAPSPAAAPGNDTSDDLVTSRLHIITVAFGPGADAPTARALLDTGTSIPATSLALFTKLQAAGLARRTGKFTYVTGVGSNSPMRVPTAVLTVHGMGEDDGFAQRVVVAVVPSLLNGTDISLLLHPAVSHRDLRAALWHRPSPRPSSSAPPGSALPSAPLLARPPEGTRTVGTPAPSLPPGLPALEGAAPLPVGLRPATIDDLDTIAPRREHWPVGGEQQVLALLNQHLSLFTPLDLANSPLLFPSQRVETTSEHPFDSSYATVWKRFSATQYRSFMATVHDIIRSGHANWVDEYGFTLLTLPGDAGPGARAPRAAGAPHPRRPWIHSPVFVPKGDGARVAIDFRPLNSRTVPLAQTAMPSCNDTLNSLAGALLYSSMDAANYHYQIHVEEADRHKSCFRTPLGIVRLNVVGQGWTNSSVVAQKIMDAVVGPLAQPTLSHATAPSSATAQPTLSHATGTSAAPAPPSSTRTGTPPDSATPSPSGTRTQTNSSSDPDDDPPPALVDVESLPPPPPATALGMASGDSTTAPYQDDVALATGRSLDPSSAAPPPLTLVVWDAHLHDLGVLLRRARSFNLKLTWKKLQIAQQHLDHLGERVDWRGRSIDPERKLAIAALPIPTSFMEAASALGLMGHLRTYVTRYSRLAAAFRETPAFASGLADPKSADRRKAPFTLSAAQLTAWHALKAALVNGMPLAPMDHSHPVVIRSDSSNGGYGGVILVGKDLLPYGHFSWTLTGAQRNYSVADREFQAGYIIISRNWPALRGARELVWLTDHANAVHFAHKHRSGDGSISSMRVRRWLDSLYGELFAPLTLIRIPGPDNVDADALSRLPAPHTACEDTGSGWLEAATRPPPAHLLGVAQRAAADRDAPSAVIASFTLATLTRAAAKLAPADDADLAVDLPPRRTGARVRQPPSTRLRDMVTDAKPAKPAAPPRAPKEPRAPPALSEQPAALPTPPGTSSLIPGHLLASPLLLRASAAQAAAPPHESAAWSSPPFSSVTLNGTSVVLRHGSLWIPTGAVDLQHDLLELAHVATGWQSGKALLAALVGARVDWAGRRQQAASHAASSPNRQTAAPARPNAPGARSTAPRGEFAPTLSPRAGHTIYMDYSGALTPEIHPDMPDGPPHTHVLVTVDAFTREVDILSCSAADAAHTLLALDSWAATHGYPTVIRSDAGAHFNNSAVKHWAHAHFDASYVPGSPLHAAGQGLVERRMATVTYLLKSHSTEDRPWTHFVQSAVGRTRGIVANVMLHTLVRSTGLSPFHAARGRDGRSALDAAIGLPAPDPPALPLAQHVEVVAACHSLALLASSTSQAVSKLNHDRRGPHPAFAVGQPVLYLADTATKLEPVGSPYIVRRRISSSHYIISTVTAPLDLRSAPAQRLRPYDASRTIWDQHALAQLPPGHRIVDRITGHSGSRDSPPVTFSVAFSDQLSPPKDDGWSALSLRHVSAWRAYAISNALPVTPTARCYARPPDAPPSVPVVVPAPVPRAPRRVRFAATPRSLASVTLLFLLLLPLALARGHHLADASATALSVRRLVLAAGAGPCTRRLRWPTRQRLALLRGPPSIVACPSLIDLHDNLLRRHARIYPVSAFGYTLYAANDTYSDAHLLSSSAFYALKMLPEEAARATLDLFENHAPGTGTQITGLTGAHVNAIASGRLRITLQHTSPGNSSIITRLEIINVLVVPYLPDGVDLLLGAPLCDPVRSASGSAPLHWLLPTAAWPRDEFTFRSPITVLVPHPSPDAHAPAGPPPAASSAAGHPDGQPPPRPSRGRSRSPDIARQVRARAGRSDSRDRGERDLPARRHRPLSLDRDQRGPPARRDRSLSSDHRHHDRPPRSAPRSRSPDRGGMQPACPRGDSCLNRWYASDVNRDPTRSDATIGRCRLWHLDSGDRHLVSTIKQALETNHARKATYAAADILRRFAPGYIMPQNRAPPAATSALPSQAAIFSASAGNRSSVNFIADGTGVRTSFGSGGAFSAASVVANLLSGPLSHLAPGGMTAAASNAAIARGTSAAALRALEERNHARATPSAAPAPADLFSHFGAPPPHDVLMAAGPALAYVEPLAGPPGSAEGDIDDALLLADAAGGSPSEAQEAQHMSDLAAYVASAPIRAGATSQPPTT